MSGAKSSAECDAFQLTRSLVKRTLSPNAIARLNRYPYDVELLQIAIDESLNSAALIAAGLGLTIQSLLELIAQYTVAIDSTSLPPPVSYA